MQKRILSMILVLAMTIGLLPMSVRAEPTPEVPSETSQHVFTDIADHWAKEDIEFVIEKGLLNGTAEGIFSPDRPITRAEISVLLRRLIEPASQVNWEVVEAAYNYSLPLLMMNATKEKITNRKTPTGAQAPINQFAHSKGLANAKSLDVVTPNTDTIYSQAFLDLSTSPMVLVKPKVDRYVTIQAMDAYTNTVKILGTGGDTQDEQTYLLTGPDYKGELPAEMVEVAMPQNMGWILGRTLCKGVDDLENVYAIQNQFKLMPLEDYLKGGEYRAPEGSYHEKYNFIPVNHVLQMTPQEFFQKANQLMLENPPAEVDHEIMALMASINVGPGKTFDARILGKTGEDQWKNMIGNLGSKLTQESQEFSVKMGPWKYLGKPISEFGTEYTYRALVALGGLGANPVNAAIYTRVDKDESGSGLNGSQSYTIHFEKDSLPKTRENGFWSITAYNGSNFLIDNPLNRYDINDRDSLKFNNDGSLDITIQADAPKDSSMVGNWLPVSKDDFHLYMRIYLPHEDVLSGVWEAPTLMKN